MESTPEDGAVVCVTSEGLAAIEDEEVLNKMLDNADTFEERRLIRAALRDLLKKKRDKREQERGSRQQDLRQALGKRSGGGGGGGGGRGGVAGTGRAAMKSTTNCPPDASTTAGGKAGPAQASSRGPPSTVPNAKNVKQMLLDWCRAKTEPYEGVNIRNFSSSWKDGIAFCALVHRFFPDAFEYSVLNPHKPGDNFQLAFSTAERLAGCPPLLDPDDLVRMEEPDWKCVYTYIQEFYRCLVEKGLVKTKKRA
ncbi:smoothelin [Entelurus aequoreus]|uniref:smoothelin n=1 Tax=Entelurus aequoreus TaxID=161455 RepID=UPI002B1E2712|nr:smoothelin [Entelurus aequoreus]XP_061886921.1 smoothelin [Entelurus aequoreus]XP_061886922.1 smoothelin [Entelurus aequoreus]